MLRQLLNHAVDQGMLETNPTFGIKLKSKSQGFHTWTEDEIAQFEARWPIGTKQRLAFGLLLYTAQCRGDVITMGRQHVRNGVLYVTQSKTGVSLEIPIHPTLAEIMRERCPECESESLHFGGPLRMPCLRQTSAVLVPASCSRKMPMSSVNRLERRNCHLISGFESRYAPRPV
jgi:integrase